MFINDNEFFVAVWRSGFSRTGHQTFMPNITLTDWHGKPKTYFILVRPWKEKRDMSVPWEKFKTTN